MKQILRAFGLMLCGFVLLVGSSIAQDKPAEAAPGEWVAPWLVTVKDRARPLLLRVNQVIQKDDRTDDLDATFNYLGVKGRPVVGQVVRKDLVRLLLFTTQSGNQYSVTQVSENLWEGSYTDSKGNVKQATIERLTEEALKEKLDAINPPIVVPGANVPEACAAFSGEWVGTWTVANAGTSTLRIFEINDKCIAKFLITGFARREIEIKEGALTFLCNQSTQGICVFKFFKGELWANYANPQGGRNQALFRKQ